MDPNTVIPLMILAVIVAVYFARKDAKEKARKAHEAKVHKARQRHETQQSGDARELADWIYDDFGYIAPDVLPRAEIEQRIAQGWTAERLAETFFERLYATDGLIIGDQCLGEGATAPVILTDRMRERHIYIVGKTGSGKTNEMRRMIFQDLEDGRGVGIIGPESEMFTEEILSYIPEHRIDDVIYVDPNETGRPICFNPLHLDEGEDLDLKVDETLTIFRRVFGDMMAAPRMQEILRHTLYTLIARPDTTLLDVEPLLSPSDPSFREMVIASSSDEMEQRFWAETYPSLSKDAHLPITTRLGQFIRSEKIRTFLCQPGKSLDIHRVMDEERILCFNLSEGHLGETTSQLIGQLIVSKLQMATMARALKPKTSRRPFYLYIDEFQTFCGTAKASYEKILSRARKYHLSLVLAHQQTHQIPTEVLHEIMGNVSTMLVFTVAQADAARFSKEFLMTDVRISEPSPSSPKLPAFVAYMKQELTRPAVTVERKKVHVPPEAFLNLPVGHAYCKIGQHSIRLMTELADQLPDMERTRMIIEHSRENWGIPVARIEPDASQEDNASEEASPSEQEPRVEIDPQDVF